MSHSSRSKLLWTLALFFFSGATSLVYEVLWTRRLSLTFGHTVLAVSTVLTVFMSGLALGSFLAGRWSDKERQRLEAENSAGPARFLALYGKLEIGIGVWAVLSLVLLNGVEALYLAAARAGAGSSSLYTIVFLGSFLVLLPPTTAMGATLPVFTQLLVATKQDVGTWLSRIYGWNTLGACLGAGLGGFLLLPSLGLKLSVSVAALGNLAIGVFAIKAATGLDAPPQKPEEPESEDGEDEGHPEGAGAGSLLLPIAFGVSGFAAMLYQLGWTRGLILSIGSSTYSFAIILTAFLASLGLGSLIYKRVMARRNPTVSHLAYLQFGIAFSALLTTSLIGRLPSVMVKVIPALNYDFVKILLFDFGLCVGLMLLPTLAMGLTFPLVTQLYTDQLSSLGKRLGEAYAANTLGAILGSFLGGFFLVPNLGAQKALMVAVALNLIVGGALASFDSGGRKMSSTALVLFGAIGLLFAPTWDPTQFSAGAGIYAKAENFYFRPAYHKDGLSATVTVGYNEPRAPYLKVNGKTDASVGSHDMPHQVLLGLVPVSLHPSPKRVALVGLGSGVTAATLVAAESVEDVDCAELEPAIVEVQNYFAPYNDRVLEDPKLHLSVTDGRTFILGSPHKYDLIISQPSNPWIAGIGNLFTEDFYRACMEQLQEDGFMCQWFQLYSVSRDDLELVLQTFFTVFPEGFVVQTGPGDVLLIGSQNKLEFDAERLKQVWKNERLASWAQQVGLLESGYLLGTYVTSREQVIEKYLGGKLASELNTDDKPLLEFRAPRSLYLKTTEAGAFPEQFQELLPKYLEQDAELNGEALLGRFQLRRFGTLESKIESGLKSQIPWSPLAAALLLAQSGNLEGAEGLLRAVSPERAKLPAAQILLGDFRARAKQWDLALLHYENALSSPPPGARYSTLMKLAKAAAEVQNYEEAVAAYNEAAELTRDPAPLTELGHITYLQTQDAQASLEWFEKALERDPNEYLALFRAAFMKKELGDLDGAIRYAERSAHLFRESVDNLVMLSNFYVQAGRNAEAASIKKEALDLKQRAIQLRKTKK